LLVDARTGHPLPLDYAHHTARTVSGDGFIRSATIQFPPGSARGPVRAHLMIDTYPAASAAVVLPDSPPWAVSAVYGMRSGAVALRAAAGRIARRVMLTVLAWWGS
jgi:hypothetical protein